MDERGRPDERSTAREVARVLLPTIDPDAQAQIADLLAELAASGVDAGAALREGLHAWFGPRAAAALPAPSDLPAGHTPERLTLEPLPPLPRPRLWPQRPKRRPGELFSSWLWRAALAAGVPSRLFARDVAGGPYDDIDRDLAPDRLSRLASASGQSARSLGGGLILPGAALSNSAELAADPLLADEQFLLGRRGYDRQGRPLPVLQYCPLCLHPPNGPFFDRVWRLTPFAVCLAHGCRLHDGCWRCGTPVMLLDQRTSDPVPRCGACDAAYIDAPVMPDRGARLRLHALTAMLSYVGSAIGPNERDVHLAKLASVFPDPTATAAQRTRTLRRLRASEWPEWFGAPAQDRHTESLKLLASGAALGRLSQPKAAQRNSARSARVAIAPSGDEIEVVFIRRPAGRRRAR